MKCPLKDNKQNYLCQISRVLTPKTKKRFFVPLNILLMDSTETFMSEIQLLENFKVETFTA